MRSPSSEPGEEEKETFLQQGEASQWQQAESTGGFRGFIKAWWRYGFEALLVVIIIALLFSRELASHVGSHNSISSGNGSSKDASHDSNWTPVPSFARKPLKFMPNTTLVNDGMFESEAATLHTLHRWIPLSSDARGYISVPDYESYTHLPTPFILNLNRTTDGPGYMISMFHQLHCLSYLVQHFQKGFSGVELTHEIAHHSAHCVDYIRQGIMCAGDTALEGKTEAGPGFGSEHMCVDYEAVQAWANEHSAEKWRNLMPEESVL